MTAFPPWALTALRLTVSALCLGLAFWLMPDGALPQLAEAQPGWLVVAVGLGVVAIAIMATRLRVLMGAGAVPLRTAITVTWAGQFGAMLGLGLLSADGARITILVRTGCSVASASQLIVLDRALGLSGLAILAAAGGGAHLLGLWGGFAVLLIGLAAALAMLLAMRLVPGLRRALPENALPLGQLALALVLSVLLHSVTVVTFLIAALALGLTPPLPEAIIAVSIGLFFAILPVSLGGWGVRELAIAQAFAWVGAPFAGAVPSSVLFGVLAMVVALPGVIALGLKPRAFTA
mgnify:CR=1 FL=1